MSNPQIRPPKKLVVGKAGPVRPTAAAVARHEARDVWRDVTYGLDLAPGNPQPCCVPGEPLMSDAPVAGEAALADRTEVHDVTGEPGRGPGSQSAWSDPAGRRRGRGER